MTPGPAASGGGHPGVLPATIRVQFEVATSLHAAAAAPPDPGLQHHLSGPLPTAHAAQPPLQHQLSGPHQQAPAPMGSSPYGGGVYVPPGTPNGSAEEATFMALVRQPGVGGMGATHHPH